MTAAFGGTAIDILGDPWLDVAGDVAGPGMFDGGGMDVAGWVAAAPVVAGGVGLLVVGQLAATSTTSGDGGTSVRDGAA